MNKLRLKLLNKEPLAVALVLFTISFLIGIIFSKVGAKLLLDGFDSLNENYFERITDSDIDYLDLLQYILITNYKKFIIFILLSITILAIPYMVFLITKMGFQLGFLFCALCMQYEWKGFLLMFVYVFPQALIYVPVILNALKSGYEIALSMNSSKASGLQNFYILRNYKKLIILLTAGIFLGAILEAFIGSLLIKKVLSLF